MGGPPARAELRSAAVRVTIQASPAFAFGTISRFTGPGRLWLQTCGQNDLLDWLMPRLSQSQNDN